jgi:hypothetical protein
MIKNIFLTVALVVCVVAIPGCGKSSAREVAVIEKTKSYHREECAKVKMADAKIEAFTPAIKADYKPCPYCKPDTVL